jgi:hypothetical protein
MPGKPRRNATIADGMLLVAGAGLAFFAWRGLLSMPIWRTLPDSLQRYYFQALGTVALLVPLSLCLLVVALRSPRPRLRRVVSEPAAVVGLSVLFVLIVDTALLLAVMGLAGGSPSTFANGKVLYYCRLLAEQAGMVVGSVWHMQAIGGRWPRSRNWMDIAGWVVGAYWIILAIISVAFTLL